MLVVRIWLAQHFIFRGKRRKALFANGDWYDRAYGYFMRTIVGCANLALTRSPWFYRMGTYINDMFPKFLEYSPFENPEYYAFPFKTVTIDHMVLVYQMPERWNLLDIAEERGMLYDEFYDYVINYALCDNDTRARPRFTIRDHALRPLLPSISVKGYRVGTMKNIRIPTKFKNRLHG